MAAVNLNDICKWYGNANELAVDHVSFDVKDGEFMVLLGPSGCGKSTTLRMIAGLETISDGALTINGVRMNTVAAKDRDISMVFQSYALYPHMSVGDNMAFGLRRRGFDKKEIDRRVMDAANILGLSQLLSRKPHALSGGQRQRVALGRAIVREPQVFLFDEPLSNLDAALRHSTRNELVKQHQRLGATMIYVTHDQVEAMTMGDRICVMNKGKLVQVGAPMDVYRNPVDTFVARFLGSPPMNLLEANLMQSESGTDIVLGAAKFRLSPSLVAPIQAHIGKQVIFGIRAEDVREGVPGSGSGLCALHATVSVVEPLGAETLITATPMGTNEEIIIRASRETPARAGDTIPLYIDLESVRLFDSTTQKALH